MPAKVADSATIDRLGMVYSKTVLLQTSAVCTASSLSSRYVRSLYNLWDPLNNTRPPLEYLKANQDWVKTLTDKERTDMVTGEGSSAASSSKAGL